MKLILCKHFNPATGPVLGWKLLWLTTRGENWTEESMSTLLLLGNVFQRFCSFLTDRSHKGLLGDVCLTSWPSVSHKVMDHIFDIYMKPLGDTVMIFGLQCHQYIDNTQLSFFLSFFPLEPKRVVETLNC